MITQSFTHTRVHQPVKVTKCIIYNYLNCKHSFCHTLYENKPLPRDIDKTAMHGCHYNDNYYENWQYFEGVRSKQHRWLLLTTAIINNRKTTHAHTHTHTHTTTPIHQSEQWDMNIFYNAPWRWSFQWLPLVWHLIKSRVKKPTQKRWSSLSHHYNVCCIIILSYCYKINNNYRMYCWCHFSLFGGTLSNGALHGVSGDTKTRKGLHQVHKFRVVWSTSTSLPLQDRGTRRHLGQGQRN
jgi:hypothetical protein